jgi:hypothetical protein
VQAPIRTQLSEKNANEHQRSLSEWCSFVDDVRSFYDVDLSCMTNEYDAEQKEYLHQTASWSDVHPGNLLGKTSAIKEFDLRTISLDEVKGPIKASFDMLVTRMGPVQGLLGFFDAWFEGSPENPAEHKERPFRLWRRQCAAQHLRRRRTWRHSMAVQTLQACKRKRGPPS